MTRLPPRNLTPTLCAKLREDLLEAAKVVGEKHGLIAEVGEPRDIDLRSGFELRLRFGIALPDGTLFEPERALFEVMADMYGLRPEHFGAEFVSNGECFRITGLNPNRPRYPISAERIFDGRNFKFTAENVAFKLAGLGPFETGAEGAD